MAERQELVVELRTVATGQGAQQTTQALKEVRSEAERNSQHFQELIRSGKSTTDAMRQIANEATQQAAGTARAARGTESLATSLGKAAAAYFSLHTIVRTVSTVFGASINAARENERALRDMAVAQGLAVNTADSLDASFGRAETSVNKLAIAFGNFSKGPAKAGLDVLSHAADIFREGFAGEDPNAVRFQRFLENLGQGQALIPAAQAAQAAQDRDIAMARATDLIRLQDVRNRSFQTAPIFGTGTVPGAADPAFARGAVFPVSEARQVARIAYLDQLQAATRELTDAYRQQNEIERESIQLSGQLAQAQLMALPATERLQDLQTRMARDQILLRMRGQISPEERRAARLDIRDLTRNVLPGAELAALNAEIGTRPAARALARNRLLGTIGAAGAAVAEQRVELIVSGAVGVHVTGDTGVLSDDARQRVGEEIVGMFHTARVAAENTASARLAGA